MNTWFQFKEFIIHQDKCAMKVCTDACLFGAWAAEKISSRQISPKNILDIGCGTGLLSLMLAQKSAADIDAVEIDEDAYVQASENIGLSPWKDRINIYHTSITDFHPIKKYDFIISNPPFYENDLVSPDEGRNKAMHDAGLNFESLARSIKQNLAEGGKAAILLPFHRVPAFAASLSKEELSIQEKMNMAHSPKHTFFRAMLMIGFEKADVQENSMNIRNELNEYSNEFIFLLKDYYLQIHG